ncbi:hypothetical protein B0H21DRAFT_887540 [Amylocystis lapponica]|nr:hypothetical protein B0H21DRAFT_887540 [Amylocystis lapponica]
MCDLYLVHPSVKDAKHVGKGTHSWDANNIHMTTSAMPSIQGNAATSIAAPTVRRVVPGSSQESYIGITRSVHGVVRVLFRVLVVGRTGAGKSSLINAIFKCTVTDESEFRPGESDIEREITSDTNPRFVMHDPQGYEPGETQKFDTLKMFIEGRCQEEDESKRLHAIWLCISTPFAGGRVWERGDEKLFKLKRRNVPIIVVFTKFDYLFAKYESEMNKRRDAMSDVESAKLQQDVEKMYHDVCIKPLKAGLKFNVPPYLRVSVVPGYEDTLANLVETTQKQMRAGSLSRFQLPWKSGNGPGDDSDPTLRPSEVVLATAQGVDADSKIKASIECVTQFLAEYWWELPFSTVFKDKALHVCFDALHKDIILVWNFTDIHDILSSLEFRFKFLETLQDLIDEQGTKRRHNIKLQDIIQVIGATAGFVPHAVIIIPPIAAVVLIANFLYDVYENTPSTVCCLMAYIIDLTLVMHRLFQRSRPSNSAPLSSATVDEVLEEFDTSAEKKKIHDALREFVKHTSFSQASKSNFVFQKVVSLIREHTEPTNGDVASGA